MCYKTKNNNLPSTPNTTMKKLEGESSSHGLTWGHSLVTRPWRLAAELSRRWQTPDLKPRPETLTQKPWVTIRSFFTPPPVPGHTSLFTSMIRSLHYYSLPLVNDPLKEDPGQPALAWFSRNYFHTRTRTHSQAHISIHTASDHTVSTHRINERIFRFMKKKTIHE